MSRDDLVVLTGPDIRRILEGRQRDVMTAVGAAYVEHYRGHSCLPHSVFVRFPDRTKERIQALLEGSLISAARTAASAALAADKLHEPGAIGVLGVVGCGLINREIVGYIARLGRDVGRVLL